MNNWIIRALFGVASVFFATGCMSSPALVGFALPVIIKSDEKKLTKAPDNESLRVETGSYYIMYANAFIEGPAKMLPVSSYEKRDKQLAKAKKRYLRGVEILRAGLEKKYPGIGAAFREGKLPAYLKRLKKEDVPELYWTVAGTLAAYSIDPMDLDLGLKLPELTALILRAYELDPAFNNGALDDFFVLFYGALPPPLGGDRDKAKAHFRIALEKTGGNAASPYVSYAEVIAIPEQDYAKFKEYLGKALAVDFRKMKDSEEKLANKIAQRRARFLLKNAADYFILDE
jgi:predicted anti-sigma-YlaC factor YlaD